MSAIANLTKDAATYRGMPVVYRLSSGYLAYLYVSTAHTRSDLSLRVWREPHGGLLCNK